MKRNEHHFFIQQKSYWFHKNSQTTPLLLHRLPSGKYIAFILVNQAIIQALTRNRFWDCLEIMPPQPKHFLIFLRIGVYLLDSTFLCLITYLKMLIILEFILILLFEKFMRNPIIGVYLYADQGIISSFLVAIWQIIQQIPSL